MRLDARCHAQSPRPVRAPAFADRMCSEGQGLYTLRFCCCFSVRCILVFNMAAVQMYFAKRHRHDLKNCATHIDSRLHTPSLLLYILFAYRPVVKSRSHWHLVGPNLLRGGRGEARDLLQGRSYHHREAWAGPQFTFTPNLLSAGIYFQRPAGTGLHPRVRDSNRPHCYGQASLGHVPAGGPHRQNQRGENHIHSRLVGPLLGEEVPREGHCNSCFIHLQESRGRWRPYVVER
jgi:hypothetical protein